jgi:hypothetical protein
MKVLVAPFTLSVRTECPTNIRSFLPTNPEPVQILEHCIGELRFRPLWIQILISQNQDTTGIARSRIRRPESSGMAHMQQSRRRGSNAPPIPISILFHAASLPVLLSESQAARSARLRDSPGRGTVTTGATFFLHPDPVGNAYSYSSPIP